MHGEASLPQPSEYISSLVCCGRFCCKFVYAVKFCLSKFLGEIPHSDPVICTFCIPKIHENKITRAQHVPEFCFHRIWQTSFKLLFGPVSLLISIGNKMHGRQKLLHFFSFSSPKFATIVKFISKTAFGKCRRLCLKATPRHALS